MQHKSYSLSREYSDKNGLVLSGAFLGAVIGFSTGVSSLIQPQAQAAFNSELFSSITVFSIFGSLLGICASLVISGIFQLFASAKTIRKTAPKTENLWHSDFTYHQLPATTQG